MFQIDDTTITFTFNHNNTLRSYVRDLPTGSFRVLSDYAVEITPSARILNEIRQQVLTSALLAINGVEKAMPIPGDYATAVKYLLIDEAARVR